MALNKNIVPIVYISGTGGHFLSSFIRSARLNNDPYSTGCYLSTYGNAHNARLDMGNVGGFSVPPEVQIEKLLKFNLPDPPYYPPVHLHDIDPIMQEFEKSIKITYTGYDVYEISIIYFMKWGIEAGNYKVNNIYDILWPTRMTMSWMMKNLKGYRSSDNYGDRLLDVSWKELFEKDPDILVEKLSKFTGIPSDQFPRQSLENWRILTKKGRDIIDTVLNTGDIGLIIKLDSQTGTPR